ncbi:hypothetical protein K440DRAFT_643496 [Wilcoxina mikolae CBS 423.85]|nr:hypothetical protein K440DRAFT_643496 [Wilcoxina mikolae CBS 423.85]
MSNAMKKLKLLHHLTAASASHSSPPPAAAATPTTQPPQQQQQQFPTPPASPVSPQTSTIRHLYHPTTQTHAHYTDVLRSARAALHTLHASQPSYTNTSHPPPPPPPSANMPTNTTQCLLPGGFMVLTPTNSYDNTPGLCVPASPPQTMAINSHRENTVPRGNTTIYSSRPPPPPPPATSSPKNASYHYHHQQPQRQRSPPRPRQRLTREAVAKIGKDSRLARWERVLGYVREQRTSTLPSVSASPVDGGSEGVAWASYAYSSTNPNNNGAHSSTPPSKVVDRKRRAEEIATIEARNALLDTIDRAEQDQRSLWSGGSGGTNGVDEFVWSEDEDEDNIITMPQLPPPKKVFVEELDETEAGIFEMQVDEEILMAPPTRTSTPLSGKRPRPKSTPEEQMAFQRSALWGKRIVEEMPALCREISYHLERL